MSRKTWLLAILVSSSFIFSQSPLATKAPIDRPVGNKTLEDYNRMLEAIKPYVAQDKKTWPAAKGKYLKGLPAGHVFSITTELVDMGGHHEIVFVTVQKIADGIVSGTITNEINAVRGYSQGQKYSIRETDILDWTITKPDGTEEGNAVGKFLDTYTP